MTYSQELGFPRAAARICSVVAGCGLVTMRDIVGCPVTLRSGSVPSSRAGGDVSPETLRRGGNHSTGSAIRATVVANAQHRGRLTVFLADGGGGGTPSGPSYSGTQTLKIEPSAIPAALKAFQTAHDRVSKKVDELSGMHVPAWAGDPVSHETATHFAN